MNRYYTRTGDNGYTGILGEGRLPKNHPRLEAVGSLDEASAALGLARAACQLPQTKLILLAVQRDLYSIMAEVAASPEDAPRFRTMNADRVTWLEQQIEIVSSTVELPREFTVAGDTFSGAALDLARTIVRRAERRLTELQLLGEIENADLLRYINRLSSLCYLLAGSENVIAGEGHTLAKR